MFPLLLVGDWYTRTPKRRIGVESSWNVTVHGDARVGKWRGNWRMEWVASTLYTTSEHGVSSITTADAHTSAASTWLNWRPRRFKWTRPFRRKTKSCFCACAITFQTQSTCFYWHNRKRPVIIIIIIIFIVGVVSGLCAVESARLQTMIALNWKLNCVGQEL
jgi:hypothetical protein